MANIEQLKTRKRQLFGATVTVPSIPMEDLAFVLKLSIENKPLTAENILIEKMKTELPLVPQMYQPFCQAVMELYAKSNQKKGTN